MRESVVGSYRITGPLGTGGMGTVYCAEHVLIGKPAAVKVLLPQYGRDHGIVARFFNEARAVGAIHHPGIVELYDFGYMDDGSAYIVMELLRGETLASRIARRGRLYEPEALAIVRGIAGALAAVHAKGIVHRDIKPENVFLVPDSEATSGERIKVLDFGIAKLTDDQGALTQTSTNAMLGTPMYMSPEQCRGAGQVDHRADLYALGCVLFEMLAGVPPFVGEGAGEVIAAHLHVAPPELRRLAPEVSPVAEQIVTSLLAKRAEDRLQTAHALLQLLNRRGAASAATSHAQVTLRLTSDPLHAAASNITPLGASGSVLGSIPGSIPGSILGTTLGTAAGAIARPSLPSRRGPAFAGAAVIALAIAAIVLVLRVRGREDAADALEAPAHTVEASRPPAPPTPSAASPLPSPASPSPTPASAGTPPSLAPPTTSVVPTPPATANRQPSAAASPSASRSQEPSISTTTPASVSPPPSIPSTSNATTDQPPSERSSKTVGPTRGRRSGEPRKVAAKTDAPKADAPKAEAPRAASPARKAPVVEDL